MSAADREAGFLQAWDSITEGNDVRITEGPITLNELKELFRSFYEIGFLDGGMTETEKLFALNTTSEKGNSHACTQPQGE